MLGIFPMANSRKDKKIIFIDPEYRALIPIRRFKASKSLVRIAKKRPFEITMNKAFADVIRSCAIVNRTETWINEEIENLFKILKRLSKSGCSILYISHKLEEIIELANQVTILKSGKCVSTLNAKTTSTKELAETMVGKKITKLKKNNIKNNKTVAFEVKNLNKIIKLLKLIWHRMPIKNIRR